MALVASAILGLAGLAKLLAGTEAASVQSINWLPRQYAVVVTFGVAIYELVAASLLLRPATRRHGARLTAAAGLAFSAFTIGLLQSGAPADCGCFGTLFSLSAPATLALDILLLCCGYLLLSEPARGPSGSEPQRFGAHWSRQSVPERLLDGLAIGAGLLVGLFVWGAQSQWANSHHGGLETLTAGVRESQRVPDVQFVNLAGEAATIPELGSSWVSITFATTTCQPCRDEVAELAVARPAWANHVEDWMVIVGPPPNELAARQFAYPAHRILFDPQGAAAKRICDRPTRFPTSVVIDPEGTVRFVQSGRETGVFSLASDLRNHAEDRRLTDLDPLIQGFWYGRRAPDGKLLIDGRERSLAELQREGPLVLAFLTTNCRSCDLAMATLDEARQLLPNLRIVQVTQDGRAPITGREGWLSATDANRALATRFAALGGRRTFLVAEGRLWYASTSRGMPGQLTAAVQDLARRSADTAQVALLGTPRGLSAR